MYYDALFFFCTLKKIQFYHRKTYIYDFQSTLKTKCNYIVLSRNKNNYYDFLKFHGFEKIFLKKMIHFIMINTVFNRRIKLILLKQKFSNNIPEGNSRIFFGSFNIQQVVTVILL